MGLYRDDGKERMQSIMLYMGYVGITVFAHACLQ